MELETQKALREQEEQKRQARNVSQIFLFQLIYHKAYRGLIPSTSKFMYTPASIDTIKYVPH